MLIAGTQPARYFWRAVGGGGSRANLERQLFFCLLCDSMVGNMNNIVWSDIVLLQCEEDSGLFAIYQRENL